MSASTLSREDNASRFQLQNQPGRILYFHPPSATEGAQPSPSRSTVNPALPITPGVSQGEVIKLSEPHHPPTCGRKKNF